MRKVWPFRKVHVSLPCSPPVKTTIKGPMPWPGVSWSTMPSYKSSIVVPPVRGGCSLHHVESHCVILRVISFSVSSPFSPFYIPIDKNQYVHRRDSVSVTSLSEQEIQRRIQLGFITPSLGGNAAAVAATVAAADSTQSEEWQDITDQEVMQDGADGHDDDDDPTETEGSMEDHNPYLLDTHRRSSIDLGHLSFNRHDESVLLMNSTTSSNNNHATEVASSNGGTSGLVDHHLHHSNKRLRYRQPSIASISEEEQLPSTGNNNNNSSNVLMDNDEDDDEVATVDGNDADVMEDI
jgi:hypothetical protein